MFFILAKDGDPDVVAETMDQDEMLGWLASDPKHSAYAVNVGRIKIEDTQEEDGDEPEEL